MRHVLLSSVVMLLVLLAVRDPARASPSSPALEDRVADDELDAEDLVGRATVGRGTLRKAPGGDAWLSLGGFSRRMPDGQREIGGLVVVNLPFERLLGGARTETVGRASVSTAAPELGAVTPKVARSTVEAAWRAASLGSDDRRLDGILSRARWSALLPETRLRAVRFEDQRLSTDASLDASRLRDSTGANVGFEARLTWRFDRLLFADEEPSFERMRLERHDARARIAARALEALFHWQRAWLDVRSAQAASRDAREPPGRPSREEAEAALRVLESEATLDVLTGGWFTSARNRSVPRPASLPPSAPLPEAL